MPIDVTLSGKEKELPQKKVNREPVSEPAVDPNPAPMNAIPPRQNNPAQGAPILNGVVNIPMDKVPIVVFFGPTSCGKSMGLKRVIRYLRKSGDFTSIEPERTFRPANDKDYQADCDDFNNFVTRQTKEAGTTGYMLVNVIDTEVKCRLLEAPGEYYFDPENPEKDYPVYMNTIMGAPNPRIWCIFVEPNWLDQPDRENYVARINALKPEMQRNDVVIFVFNKIDSKVTKHLVISPGEIRTKEAIKFVATQYPGIFNLFKNDIPILKWFKEYTCGFIPFQTGKYTEGSNNYADSVDEYPAMLWKAISKYL